MLQVDIVNCQLAHQIGRQVPVSAVQIANAAQKPRAQADGQLRLELFAFVVVVAARHCSESLGDLLLLLLLLVLATDHWGRRLLLLLFEHPNWQQVRRGRAELVARLRETIDLFYRARSLIMMLMMMDLARCKLGVGSGFSELLLLLDPPDFRT